MTEASKLTLRQMIEGMTLTFDPQAAGDLDAIIQFDVTGSQPGSYYLRIADGDCTFRRGTAENPSLTISTPSDVWLEISAGELDGQEALMQGLYQVKGDISLMLRMDALFKPREEISLDAPADQRPAGPLAIPGMTWLTVALLPWTICWITFDMIGNPWISVGVPFALTLLIVGYRLIFDRPTLLEWGGLGFFSLAVALTLVGEPRFALWGSVASQVVVGALWLGSLLISDIPLCGEYSKWGYVEKLWRTSLFIHPNTAISLMWGCQSLLSALLGAGAILLPTYAGILTVVRFLLLVPAFVFTSVYQKGSDNRPIANPDRALAQMRFSATIGLALAVVMLLAGTIV